ncbi:MULTISPECIES: DUF5941 domain-containing protein [Actinomadura]|uniref:DUF5941 domain-containing protein n=1 Tax=Actinomadura miaoliensis TaxID=430685 RepID=A0ABP7XA51_9ACTN
MTMPAIRVPDARVPVPPYLLRDDGPICLTLARLAGGRLPPLPGVLVAVALGAVLMTAGLGADRGPALFLPVAVVLLTGAAATHPHNGRFDWLVPPLLRTIEYGYLAGLGFAQGVPAPLVYVLLAVLAYHHYDTVYRTRQGLRPGAWVLRAGLGWEGRTLVVAAAGLAGPLPFAYAALAAYLGVLFAGESVTTWLRTGRDSGVIVDLEEEES